MKLRIYRIAWIIVYNICIRPFPRATARKWEAPLLRLFGAKIGKHFDVYSSARIDYPFNLVVGDHVCLADKTYVKNSSKVRIGSNTIISQMSYINCDNYNTTNRDISFCSKPITIGENVWIAACSYVGPGVTIGDGSVLSARTVVSEDVEPCSVMWGNPAQFLVKREILD